MTIDAEAVAAAVASTRFGRVEVRAETGSTNDDAAQMLGDPESLGRVLVAEFQREGRGRRARPWIAPPGSSLLFTAILPQALPAKSLWSVPFWCALAVAEAVAAATGCELSLQWPNDILLDGRKCCGILATSRIQAERAWVACGVGLNVRRPNDSSLAAVAPPPAFLSDVAPAVDRKRVLIAILRAFDARFGELERPAEVARAWELRARLAGTPYRILLDGAALPFDAVARALADDGSLIVQVQGESRRIALADARVLR